MHWNNSNCPGRPVGEGFGWWLVIHLYHTKNDPRPGLSKLIESCWQGRSRRQRERHPKMQLRFYVIMSRLFGAAWLIKCVPTILELNWCEQCAGLKKKTENLSSAHVVGATARQVILRR